MKCPRQRIPRSSKNLPAAPCTHASTRPQAEQREEKGMMAAYVHPPLASALVPPRARPVQEITGLERCMKAAARVNGCLVEGSVVKQAEGQAESSPHGIPSSRHNAAGRAEY